eukprot:165249-Amorphochlora_amoeboformis.AAC.2
MRKIGFGSIPIEKKGGRPGGRKLTRVFFRAEEAILMRVLLDNLNGFGGRSKPWREKRKARSLRDQLFLAGRYHAR